MIAPCPCCEGTRFLRANEGTTFGEGWPAAQQRCSTATWRELTERCLCHYGVVDVPAVVAVLPQLLRRAVHDEAFIAEFAEAYHASRLTAAQEADLFARFSPRVWADVKFFHLL